jgi:hypothetical protein
LERVFDLEALIKALKPDRVEQPRAESVVQSHD